MVSDNGHTADVDLFCQLYESHRVFFVGYSSYMRQPRANIQLVCNAVFCYIYTLNLIVFELITLQFNSWRPMQHNCVWQLYWSPTVVLNTDSEHFYDAWECYELQKNICIWTCASLFFIGPLCCIIYIDENINNFTTVAFLPGIMQNKFQFSICLEFNSLPCYSL